MGFWDVGFKNNNEIKTPNLDKLRKEGILLDQYYVQPVCSPTRAAFMTGRYPLRYGLQDSWIHEGGPAALPINETTIAQVMKNGGYDTHMVGKWHLGFYNWTHTPSFRGFNTWYGFLCGSETYFSHMYGNGFDFRNDSKPYCGKDCSHNAVEDKGKYATHLYTEHAINIIEGNRDMDKPFFLYLPYQSVHTPLEV